MSIFSQFLRGNTVCAFTSICDEDMEFFGNYWLESERLSLPFVLHLDRCKSEESQLFTMHPNCVGYTQQLNPNIEFNETHKQAALDAVKSLGFKWAMAWDVDETYEKSAYEKLWNLTHIKEDYLDSPWLNLWDSAFYIRTDNGFLEGHRVKYLRLSHKWRFDSPITNGPKADNVTLGKIDLVCLHWGMITERLRILHKERWDRIYSKSVGKNPYGFWDKCLDPTLTPVLIKHGYF